MATLISDFHHQNIYSHHRNPSLSFQHGVGIRRPAVMEVLTCECLTSCVCRCSQLGTVRPHCYRLWSRTGTGTPERLLRPVAMTTGFRRNPASPSFPRGLWSESEKTEVSERRYGRTRRRWSFPLYNMSLTEVILWQRSLSSTSDTSTRVCSTSSFMMLNDELMNGHSSLRLQVKAGEKTRM